MVLLPLLASCGASGPPPVVGRSIAHDAFGGCSNDPSHLLTWTGDGSEVMYIAYIQNATSLGPIEIHAARADGSGTRVVPTQMLGNAAFDSLAAPPDGSALYCTISEANGIMQVLPTQARAVATQNSGAVVVSSDDIHIASSWLGVSLFDASQASVVDAMLPGGGGGYPWDLLAFSPAGDQLFAGSSGGAVGATFDLAGNLVATMPMKVDPPDYAVATWNASYGIRIFETGFHPQIEDFPTGRTTPMDTPVHNTLVPTCAAWSADGAKVAFWDFTCLSNCGDDTRLDLEVADAGTGTSTSVAHGNHISGGQMAFSPDGTRIAYVFDGGDMYVSDVP